MPHKHDILRLIPGTGYKKKDQNKAEHHKWQSITPLMSLSLSNTCTETTSSLFFKKRGMTKGYNEYLE